MASVDVHNLDGKVVGQADLSDALFGIEPAQGAIYQSVKAYLTNQRQGTANTKTRSEVDLSHRKMYRQKGTGRARAGTAGSPVRVGGGIAHGPHPRFYKEKLPQKVRQLALRSALTLKASEGRVKIVEDIAMDAPRTRTIATLRQAVAETGRALLLVDGYDANVVKSCRNIPGLEVRPVNQVCTYDVVLADTVVFTKGALGQAETLWGAS